MLIPRQARNPKCLASLGILLRKSYCSPPSLQRLQSSPSLQSLLAIRKVLDKAHIISWLIDINPTICVTTTPKKALYRRTNAQRWANGHSASQNTRCRRRIKWTRSRNLLCPPRTLSARHRICSRDRRGCPIQKLSHLCNYLSLCL